MSLFFNGEPPGNRTPHEEDHEWEQEGTHHTPPHTSQEAFATLV